MSLATDNSAARDLAYNPEHHKRTKHIERRHYFVRECVENMQLVVPYVNTLDNEADLFTKPLIPRLFYPLRDALMNVPLSDSEILAMGGRGNAGGRVPQGVGARSA